MQPNDMRTNVVYIHRRADDGLCFYVGMGRPARPHDHKNRSLHWKRVALVHGVITEVIYKNLTFEEAVTMERSYIAHFTGSPLGKLVNLTSGGEGMPGIKNSDETRMRKSESATRLNADPSFKERKTAQLNDARRSSKRLTAIREKFNDPVFMSSHLKRFAENRGSIANARKHSYTPEANTKRGASVRMYLTAPETRHIGLMKVALMIATRWKHPFTKLPKGYFK